jgi:hypothetical protein
MSVEPAMPGANDAASSDGLSGSAGRIRETTKWIIAGFAAIGALLVAGTQLSSIGDVDWTSQRGAAAMGGGVVAVVGISLAVWHASRVLTAGPIALADVTESRASKTVRKLIDDNVSLRAGFPNVTSLQIEYNRAVQDRTAAAKALFRPPTPTAGPPSPTTVAPASAATSRQQFRNATNEYRFLDGAVALLLRNASELEVRQQFTSARPWLFAGALLAAVGIGFFTWGINPPASSDNAPRTVTLAPLDVITVSLTPEGARLLGADLGSGCDIQRLRIAVPRGITDAVEAISVPDGACNAVRFRLDAATGTIINTP